MLRHSFKRVVEEASKPTEEPRDYWRNIVLNLMVSRQALAIECRRRAEARNGWLAAKKKKKKKAVATCHWPYLTQ